MMKEYFDLYDEGNVPLGVRKLRSLVHKDGDWHRTSHIYIIDTEGRFLAHKRAPDVELDPNTWVLRFGGHVVAGSNYDDTAIKELQEEIGLKLDIGELIKGPIQICESKDNKEHIQIYFYRAKKDLKDLRQEPTQVAEVKWMSPDEIIQSMTADQAKWTGTPKGLKQILGVYNSLEKL